MERSESDKTLPFDYHEICHTPSLTSLETSSDITKTTSNSQFNYLEVDKSGITKYTPVDLETFDFKVMEKKETKVVKKKARKLTTLKDQPLLALIANIPKKSTKPIFNVECDFFTTLNKTLSVGLIDLELVAYYFDDSDEFYTKDRDLPSLTLRKEVVRNPKKYFIIRDADPDCFNEYTLEYDFTGLRASLGDNVFLTISRKSLSEDLTSQLEYYTNPIYITNVKVNFDIGVSYTF